ncbi:unnamed protein product [Porites evermanni]|uniref:Uncharacterized protein n=1 Tax=Porites evermanni TaxID=104178 RepID=A0ABN8N4C7_9CNID|nr:unnamed protein product [Porites evermanni]
MGSFFIKKISDLRVSLNATENLCSTVNRHSSHCSSSFTAFRRLDMDSLRKLVLRAPTKSCRGSVGIKTHPTLGDRAFQSAAPYLWNALPSAIRNMKTLDTFKTAVKTHFFQFSF